MLKRILSILLIIILTVACESELTRPDQYIVYRNSFEVPQDTLNSTGISYQMFVKEPAPYCGYKSLKIDGGCIQPAMSYSFLSPSTEAKYRLELYAKMLTKDQTAVIELVYDTPDADKKEKATIVVKSNEWEYYKADKVVTFPPNTKFKINILVGGIIFSSMNIDYLTLVDVK